MINRDWERCGEDIRRTVQDAVDSQDFGKLNQTIIDTINDAVGSISRNIKNAQDRQRYQQQSNGRAHHLQRDVYGGQAGEPYQEIRISPKKRFLQLYRKVSSIKAGGTVMAALGMTAGWIFSILLFTFAVRSFVIGSFGLPEIIVTAVFLILSVAGFVTGGCGIGICARVNRFRTYIRILGRREYCNIQELSKEAGKSARYIVKDLEDMFSRGWFLQGHFDEQKTCLIVSDGMYRQYLQLQEDRRQSESEAKNQHNPQAGQEETQEKRQLPFEVREVIKEGDAYLCKIHACNDAISGREISAKISRMEMLVDKIFDRVEQNPETVDDLHKMMEYYLPTTVKLLEAYQELDAQPVAGENIRSSKAEIEATLDTLNIAFEKLLDSLFQETAWDVSSDISVLQTLLAQEGLTEDGLKKRQMEDNKADEK